MKPSELAAKALANPGGDMPERLADAIGVANEKERWRGVWDALCGAPFGCPDCGAGRSVTEEGPEGRSVTYRCGARLVRYGLEVAFRQDAKCGRLMSDILTIPRDILAHTAADPIRAQLAQTDSVPSTERFFRACAAGEVTFRHLGREAGGEAWVALGGGYDGTKLLIPEARCPRDVHALTPMQLARVAYTS